MKNTANESSNTTNSKPLTALFLSIKTQNTHNYHLKNAHISFKDIVLVTRWMTENPASNETSNNTNTHNPSFAIFVRDQKHPWIFSSLSELKVQNWVSQLSMYCFKLANTISGIAASTQNASTCVNSHGQAYFFYYKKDSTPFIHHIGSL